MTEKRITVWVQRFPDRENLVLQWHDPETGRRKSQSAKTADPKAAEDARSDLESDLNHGRYAEASRMTWEGFRELFEAEYVTPLRPETRRNYNVTLNLFEQLCRAARLKSITERTISTFAAEMRKKQVIGGRVGLAPGSIKVHLQFLRTALNWAVAQGLMPKCPRFPTVKVPKKKPQPTPTESFERLLARAPDANMRAFLLAGWLGGLRLNEALALEREQTDKAPWLDLARHRIVFPADFVKAVEDQWVPLDPELGKALEALPRHGRKVFRFVDARTGEPVLYRAVGNRVTELARQAGVRLTMKELRKGFGCRYAGKVPAQVLQKLMRHSDIKTTMTYYANVDAAVEEAVLGPQRNSSRNSRPETAEESVKGQDVTSEQETDSN